MTLIITIFEYDKINLLHKNKMFIINIEAIEHNAKTLKNFGCNAKNNSDSTIKVLVYQN